VLYMKTGMALGGKDPLKELDQLGAGAKFTSIIGDMLERAEMFRDMSRTEIDVVAGYMQAYKAPVGVEVLQEGQRETYMFVLAEGRLDILKNTGEYGESKKIATVRAGKTIGEMSLLDGLSHSATAKVVEPSVLLLLTKGHFEQMIKEQPEVALSLIRKVATLMSLRLRQTSGVLIDYLKS